MNSLHKHGESYMKSSKLTLAIIATLTAGASFNASAIDLYVDTATEQIYAKPGPGRVLMGSFEKTGAAPGAKTAPGQTSAPIAAELSAIREDLAVKTKDLAEKTAEIKALKEQSAQSTEVAKEVTQPDAVKVSLKDGVKLETRDGNFTSEIHGRVQVDSQENINQQLNNNFLPGTAGAPTALDNNVGLRRARLSMEGTVYHDIDYKFEYDFTRGQSTAAGITDAFARYNFSKPFSVKVGSIKEPLSLEEATSDIQTSFIERNMAVNTFIDDLNVFKLGIGGNYSADRWQVAGALQTEGPGSLNNLTALSQNSTTATSNNRSGSTGDTGWELNGRVTGTPWMESNTKLLHVGGWGSYVNVNNNLAANGSLNNGGLMFANGMGGNMDRTNILNTGNLSGVSANSLRAATFTRAGGETALVYGPFSAQAEYLQTTISGAGYSNNNLYGYYGYMTYFLTGESRNYVARSASFDRVRPLHNFDMKGGNWGAWELLAGYDKLNLNSGPITGGTATAGKLGINWYLNPRVRIMTNYVHAFNITTYGAGTNAQGYTNNTTSAAFNNAKLDMIESRIQLDW